MMKYEENIPLQIIKLSLGWDRCYLYVCVGGGGEGGDRVGHLVFVIPVYSLVSYKRPIQSEQSRHGT